MKGDPLVIGRLHHVGRASVAVPQPVIAEIAYGLERLPRSKRRAALADRFELIRSELPRAVWTETVSEAYGAIKAALEKRGERIEDFDAAIAAHALAEEGVVVTANLEHVTRVPKLRIEDWAEPTRR